MKQFLKKLIGHETWNRIACHFHKIRRKIKHAIQKQVDFNKYVYPVIGRHPGKKDVFLVLTATSKNMGDHAISKAEMNLLSECGITYREITFDVAKIMEKHGKYDVFGRANVFITGGGYLGTLWPHIYEMACKIIENNPRATIVLLPNTVYYDQTPDGRKLFEASLDIFNLPNVKRIYLREKTSFDLVSGRYAAVKLVPDMVMSLNESLPGLKRNGCLICLRNDKERTLSESQTVAVYDSAEQLFGNNVTITDMQSNTDVPLAERTEKLEQKFDQFRNAELVITDRLHGMIFAAITGTPCIVLNSRSHKLQGCYEWLQQLDYICFCNNAEEICTIYAQMLHGEHTYDVEPISPWFEEMKQELIAIIGE